MVKMVAMDMVCVCCGAYVPEGRMVCPECENGRTPQKSKAEEQGTTMEKAEEASGLWTFAKNLWKRVR